MNGHCVQWSVKAVYVNGNGQRPVLLAEYFICDILLWLSIALPRWVVSIFGQQFLVFILMRNLKCWNRLMGLEMEKSSRNRVTIQTLGWIGENFDFAEKSVVPCWKTLSKRLKCEKNTLNYTNNKKIFVIINQSIINTSSFRSFGVLWIREERGAQKTNSHVTFWLNQCIHSIDWLTFCVCVCVCRIIGW